MEVLINIPEEKYKVLKVMQRRYGTEYMNELEELVVTGTPLPKGHDRLIDAKDYAESILKHYFDNSTVIRCTEIALDNAETIVEADKGD